MSNRTPEEQITIKNQRQADFRQMHRIAQHAYGEDSPQARNIRHLMADNRRGPHGLRALNTALKNRWSIDEE